MASTWEKLSWPEEIYSGPINPFSTNHILSFDLNMQFSTEIDVFIFADRASKDLRVQDFSSHAIPQKSLLSTELASSDGREHSSAW